MPYDAHHLTAPGLLARARQTPRPRAGWSIDWLRVAAWTAALVISCAVWGGIGLAVAALVA